MHGAAMTRWLKSQLNLWTRPIRAVDRRAPSTNINSGDSRSIERNHSSSKSDSWQEQRQKNGGSARPSRWELSIGLQVEHLSGPSTKIGMRTENRSIYVSIISEGWVGKMATKILDPSKIKPWRSSIEQRSPSSSCFLPFFFVFVFQVIPCFHFG